jgi:hypothetical protein
MQTCTMTLLQAAPSLVSCTSWTRCLSTGTLRNKPPSKWQHYGCEFIPAWTYIDQIVDLCLTLRYLGIPIRDVIYMFGDNKTMVDSLTQPHARLHKQHNALSFHHVWEAIVSKYVLMMHLSGKANPSDILSKHWGHQATYPILRPILFFSRNTADLIDDNEITFANDYIFLLLSRESYLLHVLASSGNDLSWWGVTRSTQPYVHMYSVCPFVSFTLYLFLLEEDSLQDDTALTLSLCMQSLHTVE